jgi:hypothetical protein
LTKKYKITTTGKNLNKKVMIFDVHVVFFCFYYIFSTFVVKIMMEQVKKQGKLPEV